MEKATSLPIPTLHPTIRQSQRFSLMLLTALIVWCVLWEAWLMPLRAGGTWWILKALPLLGCWLGVLRFRLYTFRWLSLLIWLYVTEALVRSTSEPWPRSGMAWVELGLALGLFMACVWHIRTRLRLAGSERIAQDIAHRQQTEGWASDPS